MIRIINQPLTVLLLAVLPSLSNAQSPVLTPNTKFFTVDNYLALDTKGEYYPYRTSGFYEPGAQPRLYLLPQISVNRRGIKYFVNGTSVDITRPVDISTITSINVPLRYNGSMPSESESIGIAVQTGGTPQPLCLPAPMMNAAGQPLISPYMQNIAWAVQAIREDYARYEAARNTQYENLKRWRTYTPEATGINELVVQLIIDGNTIAQRSILGAGTGLLPMLAIVGPPVEVVRRIKDGNFEVQVSYRFRDSQVGTIDASFDVTELLESYVKETQKAITQSRSSGMQLLGMGSRRTKVKQLMDQQIDRQTTGEHKAGTVIVMTDAEDSQIARFDAQFFPEVQKQQAINAHLEAAKEAEKAGNVNLAAAHLKYGEALQQGVELAEVDAVGAAAALSAGDYATFIAKGVRYMDATTKSSSSFVRVARERINTRSTREWISTSKRSVQRAVTITLAPEPEPAYAASLGILDSRFNSTARNLMLTCLQGDGPLARAGVQCGEFISRIEDKAMGSMSDYEAVMRDYSPGDAVRVLFVDLYGTTLTRSITLGKGQPRIEP